MSETLSVTAKLQSMKPYLLFLNLMLFIIACTPTQGESMQTATFPHNLVEEVALPNRNELGQEQIAFCYSDGSLPSAHQRAKVKLMTLDGSVEHELEQTLWTSTYGVDVGCFGRLATDITEWPRDFGRGDGLQGMSWSPDGTELLLGVPASNGFVRMGISPEGAKVSEQEFFQLPRYTYYSNPNLPVWSPDGTWVAFITSQTTFRSLHIVSADGTVVKPLSKSETLPGVTVQPAWSHDSSRLAYALPIPDNGIGIVDLNTGQTLEINQDTHVEIPPGTMEVYVPSVKASLAWLPGDRLILFLTNAHTPYQNILWAVEADGSNLMSLYKGDIQQIAMAPDGEKAAILVMEEKQGDVIKLLTLTAEPQIRTIVNSKKLGASNEKYTIIRNLEWSPDGTRLIFSSQATGFYNLFLWDFLSEEIEKLTDTPLDEFMPKWRPPLSPGQNE
jgi:Tol biopolymer transport system component